jgi:uncharacterized protein (TIRG00374 family)
MVYKIGVDTIVRGLVEIRLWFFVIVFLWFIVYILNALAWKVMICNEKGEKKPSFAFLLRMTITGFAINYITPFAEIGGEPYKIMHLKEYMGSIKATSSVILYSMMHVFAHIIFWMISIVLILIFYRLSWAPFVLLSVLFTVFFFAVLLFLKGYRKGMIVRTFRIMEKIPFIKKWARQTGETKSDRLREMDYHISHLHTHRRSSFYCSFFVELASRFLICCEVNIIMFALAGMFPELHVSFLDAIIITAGYSLFANMVFFIPMQIASKEGGYMLAFETLSLPSSPAFIIGIITRIRELFWIFIGIILLKTNREKLKSNYIDIKNGYSE